MMHTHESKYKSYIFDYKLDDISFAKSCNHFCMILGQLNLIIIIFIRFVIDF